MRVARTVLAGWMDDRKSIEENANEFQLKATFVKKSCG
jgi:hypothetical protein